MNTDIKKRVWIINHYAIPPTLGGLNRHYYFSKYLAQLGYEVKIFTSSAIHNTSINVITDNELFVEKDIMEVPYIFVRTSDYRGNGLQRIKNIFEFPLRMNRIAKQFSSPDIIYTSSPDPFCAFFAVRLAKKYKIPCIVEVRDLWPESIVCYKRMSRKNPIIKAMYKLEKFLYEKSDLLIFTMAGGWKYICDQKWDKIISSEKVNHINNGVDLKGFKEQSVLEIRPTLKEWMNKGFCVTYVGSIRKANHLLVLIEAAKILKKQHNHDILFAIFGDGEERKSLEKLAEDENLHNLRFFGFLNKGEVPAVLSNSKLNIIQYDDVDVWKYGGSQNKLFEYFASGRPVLSSVQMGFSLIKKYKAGVEVSSYSAEEIVKKIIEMRDLDERIYNEYCENSLRAALDHDYEYLTEKLKQLLDKVINQ